jgi:ComF family protein
VEFKTKDGLPEPACANSLADYLLHLLFPDRCLFCRTVLPAPNVMPLCSPCSADFTPAGTLCPRCDFFYSGNGLCPRCQCAAVPLQKLYALSRYDRQWRELIHDLKYHGRRSLARPLGWWLGYEILRAGYCSPQIVVPLPLHRRREKERGFNQSLLVAKYTAQVLQVPCRQLLQKNRETISQTKISRSERKLNVAGAFSCAETLSPGTVVLLIDDIYSTGATMREAASALQQRGAKVCGAVIAYNPRVC